MLKRVVKIGGSLLTTSHLGQRVQQWCNMQAPAMNLVVVGGGATVDAIRELASIHDYDDSLLHWLCVDLLETTYRLVAAQMPEWPALVHWDAVEDFLAANAHLSRATCLVRVGAFYTPEVDAPLDGGLPHSWDTTSDSLAALLARRIDADELVLLKSCSVTTSGCGAEIDWERLAKLGVVDRAFPMAVEGIRSVRCANLTDR